jgi:type III secretion protein N (ATPase)
VKRALPLPDTDAPFSDGLFSIFGRDNDNYRRVIRDANVYEQKGKIVSAYGTIIRASGIKARIGQQCLISDGQRNDHILADVVGISDGETLLLPLGNLQGIAADSDITLIERESSIQVGDQLLGRVVDGLGKLLDDATSPEGLRSQPLHRAAPNPLSRSMIDEPFHTGLKVIDSMLTVGKGQRMGIFAAAGAGKSTLLGMLARHSQVDVVVVALIGERGREVREFIENCLGPEGKKKSILVVATSDRPPIERVRAAHVATSIAEFFRDQGKHVLLLMDSATRYARSMREVGLAIGEPSVRQGYPPSVFAELPKLFERCGSNHCGAITAFFTVLLEDEEQSDPIAEEVRSILDGHIILSRKLANASQFPAVDVLASASRVFSAVTSPAHAKASTRIRTLLHAYQEVELLIRVGEYQKDVDPLADEAVGKRDGIRQFFSQGMDESVPFEDAINRMLELANASAK